MNQVVIEYKREMNLISPETDQRDHYMPNHSMCQRSSGKTNVPNHKNPEYLV
jgi:hypothetical protein